METTQRYVDGYADVDLTSTPSRQGPVASAPSPSATEPPVTDSDLQEAVDRAQEVREQQGCDPNTFRNDLEAGLARLEADGAVAGAILRQLQANLTGRIGTEPTTRDVTPDDDLVSVLAELPTGSTVALAAGTYRLDETLVLLGGVTLRGAGRGRTVLTSGAADAAVLVLAPELVALSDLAIRRDRQAGSILVAGSAAFVQLTDVTLGGARLGSSGAGGAGVLMTAAESEDPRGGTTLEVTDSRFLDNESAGIALTGTHRASIVRADIRRNGQCGVCFLGASGGAVRRSTFVGNGSAVAVTGTARPILSGNRITGGQVGIQATGRAQPVLEDNVITGARRAAVIYDDRAGGRADGIQCRQVRFGIVVGPETRPFLGDNDCTVARGR